MRSIFQITIILTIFMLQSCASEEPQTTRKSQQTPTPAAESVRESTYAQEPRLKQEKVFVSPIKQPVNKPAFNTETYDQIQDNTFKNSEQNPLSTFSADVDTASYANVRRFVFQGQLPPKHSVRIEELINYFPYNYKTPSSKQPFALDIEVADAFWNNKHQLMRIGIQGKKIDWSKRKPSNIVFLLDVSGSMHDANKLPLLQRSLKLVVDNFSEQDRVAIAVYAGASGLVLPSTSVEHKADILTAIDSLRAGGSTNGGEGIELAYKVAQQNFIPGGLNRVVLATDGDFNIGVTNQGDLLDLIEAKAKSGVFLTVLGYGMGNYKDTTLEKLSGAGNGNYAYIDTIHEARKVLVEQVGGTMITIAKDVKIQVEFNPLQVASYRLIGYENRLLNAEDFNDDSKDAGEIGSGHSVTAFYEIIPIGVAHKGGDIDPLKYKQQSTASGNVYSNELATVKIRYKEPEADTSTRIVHTVQAQPKAFDQAGKEFRFAAGVASYGMLLRQSAFRGETSYKKILSIVDTAEFVSDTYRQQFVDLVRSTQALTDYAPKKQ